MADAPCRAYLAEGRDGQRDATRLGIQGVPFLVLDQRLAVACSQPDELLDRARLAAFEG